MSPKARDVFELTLADGRRAYGVAITGGGTPYIIVLRTAHVSRPELAALHTDPIALVGQTMDALIHNGRWPIIASGYPERADVPRPNWKITIGGKLMLTDFDGSPLRALTPSEDTLLDLKFWRSPIAFQNAIEALHGLQDWRTDYDKLTVEYARQRQLVR